MKAIILTLAVLALPAHAFEATVVRVLDGDTVTVNIPCSVLLPNRLASIRIRGIDTPESRRSSAKCEAEVDKGKLATNYLRSILPKQSTIVLKNIGMDKYACRFDADVIADGVDIGKAMIAAGYARRYGGAAKQSWCD